MTPLRLALFLVLAVLASCGKPAEPGIESTADGTRLPGYTLQSVSGYRNGDQLYTQAAFVSGSSKLAMDMRFRVGIPTRLEEGSYVWNQGSEVLRGEVREVSSTFLGGQSAQPSIGGTFELLSAQHQPLYRVRIPVQQISPRPQ